MALLHSWRFTSAGISTGSNVDSIGSEGGWDQQSASNSGTRNSGGTTTSSTSPARATGANAFGGFNFARLRTLYGDSFISGSSNGYRCDLVLDNAASDHEVHLGNVTVHRLKILMRKNVDYFPVSGNWNDTCFEFHRGGSGAWPGNVGVMLAYNGADPGAPFNAANITSGRTMAVGDLRFEMMGGVFPTASPVNTPDTLNIESWPFLAAGTWEGKILDLAIKHRWLSNYNDPGGQVKYYKTVNGNTGGPVSFSTSGYVEVQYRLGTDNGNGTTTFGGWTVYNPGTMVFADGGKQVWANGPETNRHYRPTIFRAADTGLDNGAYWKLANYHDSSPSPSYDSSVYVADPDIGQDWTDFSLSDPNGGVTNSTLPSVTGTPTVGLHLTGVAGTWTGSPTLTYNWQWDYGVGFNNVGGATTLDFRIDSGFAGTNVRLAETANGATTVFSAPVTIAAVAGPVHRLTDLVRSAGTRTGGTRTGTGTSGGV